MDAVSSGKTARRLRWMSAVATLGGAVAVLLMAQNLMAQTPEREHPLFDPPSTKRVYVQDGVCPFEGCTYGMWRATAATPVFAEPGDLSHVTAQIAAGERITAETGQVHIRPVRG